MNVDVKTIRNFLYLQQHNITHVAVLHTNFHTYHCNQKQIDRMTEKAQAQCRHFRNFLNQFLYQAKSRRKPFLYQPLLITTLEGAHETPDAAHTIHFNFAIGNIPNCISTEELRQIVEHCWVAKAQGSSKKIWLEDAGLGKCKGWIDYITKEAERGNLNTWDFTNTQIPYAAFEADLS